VSGGEWNTSRERKQLASDARELEREQVRLAKRMLRDLRWSAERSTLRKSDWGDLLKLHHDYGKEGPMQLFQELVPFWSQSQIMNGGTPCPSHHFPDWLAEINCQNNCENNAQTPVIRPKNTTRRTPGSPRKPRTDKGKTRSNYTPRKPRNL
jgi:hypothetical protein